MSSNPSFSFIPGLLFGHQAGIYNRSTSGITGDWGAPIQTTTNLTDGTPFTYFHTHDQLVCFSFDTPQLIQYIRLAYAVPGESQTSVYVSLQDENHVELYGSMIMYNQANVDIAPPSPITPAWTNEVGVANDSGVIEFFARDVRHIVLSSNARDYTFLLFEAYENMPEPLVGGRATIAYTSGQIKEYELPTEESFDEFAKWVKDVSNKPTQFPNFYVLKREGQLQRTIYEYIYFDKINWVELEKY